jgi:polar amino acid transport system substrate-binding protein
MRKLSYLLAFVMFFALLATGCSSANETTNTTQAQADTTAAAADQDTQGVTDSTAATDPVDQDAMAAERSSRTTFTVGFDAEYPPYGYMDDNGGYTGFDIELAQAICDLEGWELVKTPINWDSKDFELNSGSIDCIWSGFTIQGREDQYTWSIPYVNNSQVIVTAESSGINALADLAGKTVGVQADSAALKLLESTDEDGQKDLADTFSALQEFGDYNSAFTELQAGSLDAVAMDIGVAQYQIKSRDGFKILDESLNAEQYGIGFKLGNTALRDIINEDLQKLVDNGTFTQLAEKYELADQVCLGK